jgi:histone deacetylase 11
MYLINFLKKYIYPGDLQAQMQIDKEVPVWSGIDDSPYLENLQKALSQAFEEFTPQLIIYNAGTDIIEGDPLGQMKITPNGIIKRDEIVFNIAFEKKIPIYLLLSGGYQKSNAQVIANSILNLDKKFQLHIIDDLS